MKKSEIYKDIILDVCEITAVGLTDLQFDKIRLLLDDLTAAVQEECMELMETEDE